MGFLGFSFTKAAVGGMSNEQFLDNPMEVAVNSVSQGTGPATALKGRGGQTFG